MYGITYIYHEIQVNVGKYFIHWMVWVWVWDVWRNAGGNLHVSKKFTMECANLTP